jgi:hypothetical protein
LFQSDNGTRLVARSHEVSLEEDIKYPVVIRYTKNFGGHEKIEKIELFGSHSLEDSRVSDNAMT